MNWPIVENSDILKKYQDVTLELSVKNGEQIIEEFLDELSMGVNKKMIQMKQLITNKFKSHLLIKKEHLIQAYNSISHKEELKNAIELVEQGYIKGLEIIETNIKNSHLKKKKSTDSRRTNAKIQLLKNFKSQNTQSQYKSKLMKISIRLSHSFQTLITLRVMQGQILALKAQMSQKKK